MMHGCEAQLNVAIFTKVLHCPSLELRTVICDYLDWDPKNAHYVLNTNFTAFSWVMDFIGSTPAHFVKYFTTTNANFLPPLASGNGLMMSKLHLANGTGVIYGVLEVCVFLTILTVSCYVFCVFFYCGPKIAQSRDLLI